MIVNNLKLYNFRGFDELKIDFNKKINIITGDNASGKTSILEGLYYLALTKSFKTNDDSVLIKLGKDEMSVLGSVSKNGGEDASFRIVRNIKGKQISKNDFKFSKVSDYLGEILVVAFTNFDMINLVGSAKDRRKIIEPIICQISKLYVVECNYYKKLLNERNALLKRLTFENNKQLVNVLKVLTSQLIESAKKIIFEREAFVKKVNDKINDYYSKIADCNEILKIVYLPSATIDNIEVQLNKALEKDLKKGTTSYGPHKDDYVFIINNKNIGMYGSQGQQRSALISAKLAFMDILKERNS